MQCFCFVSGRCLLMCAGRGTGVRISISFRHAAVMTPPRVMLTICWCGSNAWGCGLRFNLLWASHLSMKGPEVFCSDGMHLGDLGVGWVFVLLDFGASSLEIKGAPPMRWILPDRPVLTGIESAAVGIKGSQIGSLGARAVSYEVLIWLILIGVLGFSLIAGLLTRSMGEGS